jgi:hypothetical protein
MKVEENEKPDQEKRGAVEVTQPERERTDQPTSTKDVAAELERQSGDKADDVASPALFPEDQSEDFRKRWSEIQTGFVDEPRRAVERADDANCSPTGLFGSSFRSRRDNRRKPCACQCTRTFARRQSVECPAVGNRRITGTPSLVVPSACRAVIVW